MRSGYPTPKMPASWNIGWLVKRASGDTSGEQGTGQ
ncbi:unnamed protein product, partial [Staurois parvus]